MRVCSLLTPSAELICVDSQWTCEPSLGLLHFWHQKHELCDFGKKNEIMSCGDVVSIVRPSAVISAAQHSLVDPVFMFRPMKFNLAVSNVYNFMEMKQKTIFIRSSDVHNNLLTAVLVLSRHFVIAPTWVESPPAMSVSDWKAINWKFNGKGGNEYRCRTLPFIRLLSYLSKRCQSISCLARIIPVHGDRPTTATLKFHTNNKIT